MPKRIPISSARRFADQHKCRYVAIFAWDGQTSHVVTYGRKIEDSSRAAELGNQIKTGLGWPEKLHAEPSRLRRLQAQNRELVALIEALSGKVAK